MAIQERTKHESTISTILVSKEQQKGRLDLGRKIKHISPFETTIMPGSLTVAEDYLREGRGLIVPINHFSYPDPINAITALVEASDTFNARRILIPATLKVHKALDRVRAIDKARRIGIDVLGIMTESSKQVVTDKHGNTINPRALYRDYLNLSAGVLNHGGIVVLSSQGGRRERLVYKDAEKRAVDALTRWRGLDENTKLAVMPISIFYENPDRKVNKGFNLFVRRHVVFGKTEAYEVVRDRVIEHNATTGDKTTVDEEIFRMLAANLPDSMLGEELKSIPKAAVIFAR